MAPKMIPKTTIKVVDKNAQITDFSRYQLTK